MPALRDARPAPAGPAAPPVDARAVMAALEQVADPEIPAVSIVELGMIEAIDVELERVRVRLLPTFVGCPALEVIREAVAERLRAFGRDVEVETSFATPWTSDRISPEGREKLRGSGFAPPPHIGGGRQLPMLGDASVRCPYCGSAETTLENVFGPTQCRSIRHCAACRQPFEAFKPV
jgi:ring-1,2-phenylacetyl-CoA epoxidase subunit PaaD